MNVRNSSPYCIPNMCGIQMALYLKMYHVFASLRLKSICSNSFNQLLFAERPNLVEKTVQKASTKHPKIRKRDNLLALLRERNPDKVPKLLQEMIKLNMPIRRVISRWQVDEAHNGILLALSNLGGSGARSGPDSDLVITYRQCSVKTLYKLQVNNFSF